MTQEKAKKRGRPAQLLKMAELHAFVEFLLERHPRTELQNQVIDVLQADDFNFEMLSEAHQILVKEALKPYREHLKLQLLFDELSTKPKQTEYEAKFIELFQAYQDNQLGVAELNILKMMCTRYLNFKAQKLQYADLELYLSQIQKKDAGKKRKAENQRKFEVGGGVLSAYKVKNDDALDTEKLLKQVQIDRYLAVKLRQTRIYKKVWAMDLNPKEKIELLFEVLNQLTLFQQTADGVKILDLAIKNSQEKLLKIQTPK